MPGPFPFKQILAADPSSPAMVARNGEVLLFAPGDTAMTPLVIWDLSHTIQLPNPVTVNDLGFGPAFIHDTLDQVAWSGGGLTGTFESYRGMKDVATAAEASSEASANSSAQSAQSAENAADNAATAAAAGVQAQLAATAQEAADAKAAAQQAAQLVNAPADTVTAALVGNPASATGAALSAAIVAFAPRPGVTYLTITQASQAITPSSDPVVGLALIQGGVGGLTVTWPVNIRWDGGTQPTLSTAVGAIDVITLASDGNGGWLGKLDGRYAPPPDTSSPSGITGLTAGTATASSVPLSWTAATDNVGIAGYEYSINGGAYVATGSTGTSYTVTGLSASTTYTLYVRAYDAAGNRGLASSIIKATPPVAPVDDFTGVDGTSLIGRTTPTGGLAWATASPSLFGQSAKLLTPTITGNAVKSTINDKQVGAEVTLSQLAAEVTINYDVSTGTSIPATGRYANVGLGGDGTSNTDGLVAYIGGDGKIYLFKGGPSALTLTGTILGHPLTGSLSLKWLSGTATISINGVAVASAPIAAGAAGFSGNGRKAGFILWGSDASADNFRVTYL